MLERRHVLTAEAHSAPSPARIPCVLLQPGSTHPIIPMRPCVRRCWRRGEVCQCVCTWQVGKGTSKRNHARARFVRPKQQRSNPRGALSQLHSGIRKPHHPECVCDSACVSRGRGQRPVGRALFAVPGRILLPRSRPDRPAPTCKGLETARNWVDMVTRCREQMP
jgi:hypothetical protein